MFVSYIMVPETDIVKEIVVKANGLKLSQKKKKKRTSGTLGLNLNRSACHHCQKSPPTTSQEARDGEGLL